MRRAYVSLIAAGALAAGTVTGCSSESQVPSIGYAVDNVITTYNGNTAEGAFSAAAQAFPRVLTGFSYTGPQGGTLMDTDYGTASVVPGEALTIQYRLDPAGVYSDGIPTSCEDMALAWAARSGKFTRTNDDGDQVPMFDAASTAGYSDIERVDCQPGSKDAKVVFRPGRGFAEWKSLFGATELLPAHVATRVAGVANIVSVLQSGDNDELARIADFWNNGWKLTPDQLDLSLLPSSGPYRVESFSAEDGLVLVANERWWGNAPATPRIVLFGRNNDVKAKIEANAVEVLDIGAKSVGDLDLAGFDASNEPSRSSEQLMLATSGVFQSVDARRAFALCVPRKKLFDELGHPDYNRTQGLGSGVLNARTVQSDTLIYGPVAAAEGGKYSNADVPGSTAALAAAGEQNPTVRIGYTAPDERRAQTVRVIAEACRDAGITVQDVSSPQFTPLALRDGQVDALLGGTASVEGPAGSGVNTDALVSLRGGAGINYSKFDNPRYNDLVDQLLTNGAGDVQMRLSSEAEALLWSEMPSIPLFDSPRTFAFADGLASGVVNPTKAGAGWNMDRWVLKK